MEPKNDNDAFDLAAHFGEIERRQFSPPPPRGVTAVPDIAQLVEPVLGRPSWLVKRGYGTFITMEFGDPVLDVSEPRPTTFEVPGVPVGTMRRRTNLHGDWHLWIYCCAWTLTLGAAKLADSGTSADGITKALRVLDGQALTDVAVDVGDGSTLFSFDLGCDLRTRPAPAGTYTREPIELWKLSYPKGWVCVRTDGTFARTTEGQDPRTYWWQRLDNTFHSRRG